MYLGKKIVDELTYHEMEIWGKRELKEFKDGRDLIHCQVSWIILNLGLKEAAGV